VTLPPFERVVADHGEVVLRVCRALLGPTDADDAWSDTFLAALRAYPALRADSNVRGWLVTIAHHKSIDVLRRRARRPRPTGALPERGVDGGFGATALDDDLRDVVTALPPTQQAAVVYRYLADLSYEEVARLLDSTEAAARRAAADGIAALRRALAPPSTPSPSPAPGGVR
jgi:RNA polymerase sigma factor (sigma-70 family)